MDISNILFAILCCLLPYCTVIAIVAILGTRAKYKSAIGILKNLEQNSQKLPGRLPLTKPIKIYILIVFAFLAIIVIGLLILLLIFYINPGTVSKMDKNILWIIVPIFIIAGVVTSGILLIIFRKIFMSR